MLTNHWTSKTNVILMSCRCGGCDDDHSSRSIPVDDHGSSSLSWAGNMENDDDDQLYILFSTC